MWNVSYSKKGAAVFVGQEEKLSDAIRIAQFEADLLNKVIFVHKAGGHYKVIHPQVKEIKCTSS